MSLNPNSSTGTFHYNFLSFFIPIGHCFEKKQAGRNSCLVFVEFTGTPNHLDIWFSQVWKI